MPGALELLSGSLSLCYPLPRLFFSINGNRHFPIGSMPYIFLYEETWIFQPYWNVELDLLQVPHSCALQLFPELPREFHEGLRKASHVSIRATTFRRG